MTRGTRITPDWQPTEADMLFARSRGFSDGDIAEVADQFRDYWISVCGQRATKLDWPATWRNWVRKERPVNAKPVNGTAVYTREALEIIAAHVRAPYYQRGRVSREVMEQCVEADLLTRDEVEAKL